MSGLEGRVQEAIRHFWGTRQRQGTATGDNTGRGAVVGGAQMDGFIGIVVDLLIENGVPASVVYRKARRDLDLPGFFRPTKEWDLVIVSGQSLVAAAEFKSQVGSFGNNYNNRTEEALGNATDLWTAYREGAFQELPRPWLGYMMLLEKTPGSIRKVKVREPHFPVFPEFAGASYARRYQLLCTKLVVEGLYDSTCFMLTDREEGPDGNYQEPVPELGFGPFLTSMISHVTTFLTTTSSGHGKDG